VRAGRLLSFFGSMEAAWKAGAGQLHAAGIDQATVTSVVAERSAISPEDELSKLEKAGVHAYTWDDPEYPARLKEVDDRPPVLYVRGELTPDDEVAVAVVGTRKATPYGRQAAEHFATDLAAPARPGLRSCGRTVVRRRARPARPAGAPAPADRQPPPTRVSRQRRPHPCGMSHTGRRPHAPAPPQ
jgi:hypothetical protein